MIEDVSKENCIRAAADGDDETVRRYFVQLAARHDHATNSSSPSVQEKEHGDRPVQDDATGNVANKAPFAHFLEDMATTLFSEAIANGHVSVVQVLLSPTVRQCVGATALNAMLPELLGVAMDEDYVDIVECLLAHGADANSTVGDSSALCKAAELGSLEMAQALVAHGAKVNNRHETTGRTALHEAAKQGDVDTVAFLLSKGADIDCQDYELRETPLLSAIKKGNRRAVKFLIDAGAQLNVPNVFGSTALHVANVEGQSEIQQLLHAAGAKVLEIPRTPRR
ncbi:Tkl protein kinase [Globisporangium polare]